MADEMMVGRDSPGVAADAERLELAGMIGVLMAGQAKERPPITVVGDDSVFAIYPIRS